MTLKKIDADKATAIADKYTIHVVTALDICRRNMDGRRMLTEDEYKTFCAAVMFYGIGVNKEDEEYMKVFGAFMLDKKDMFIKFSDDYNNADE